MVSSLCWISPHTHTHPTQFFSFQKQQPYPSSFSSISIHTSNNEQNQLVPPWKYDFIPTASKLVFQLPPDALQTQSRSFFSKPSVSPSQWEKPKSFPCPAVPYITRPAYLSDLQLCCSPPCSFHSWAHHVSSHISLCVSWSFHRSTLSPGIYLSPFLRNFLQSSGQTSYQRGPPWPPSVKQETFLLNPLTHSVVTGLLFVSAHKYAISTKPRALAAVLIAVPLVPNTGPTLRRYSRSLC